MSKIKIPLWVIVAVSLMLLLLPIIMYWFKFSAAGISDSNSDWAAFSTYWATFIALVNTLVIAILTYRLYEYNKDRDNKLAKVEVENKRRENLLERPVVVFRKFTGGKYYTLGNVGKGAALNILIKTYHEECRIYNPDSSGKVWNYSCNAYALREGENEDMKWTWCCIAICAIYNDVYGNKFYSYMDADKLRTFTDMKEDLAHYAGEYEACMRDDCEHFHFSWLNENNGLPKDSSI